ncbi:MAG: MurR/RpiR family transcriptional regulator [Granulosicoccaceae bacterium]
MSTDTVADSIRGMIDHLTRSERQLADIILKNYPVSGLGTITTLAAAASVSTPTVARMVRKIGYSGFTEFQSALRFELNEKISGPIARRDVWANNAPDAHLLNRFTDAVTSNIRQTLGEIDTATFEQACNILGDTNRSIYIVGGRITRALADYFFLHMQVIRPRVVHINSISNAWPHYLLDVNEGDVVVVFDIRRYENSTLRLAEAAKERGAQIILFTDQWQSPISEIADVYFANRIAVPSAWDSSVTGMLLCELIIAYVQEQHWEATRERMEELDTLFDKTKFFRKF